MNRILGTDSYKVSHWRQYPPGTQHVYAYWESRGGLYLETVPFGLQGLIDKYLLEPITQQEINYAEERIAAHLDDPTLFNKAGWQHILKVHEGRLPVIIKAVDEGTVVPNSNVMLTIENTDPEVPWLTNYLETLLCQLWYPTTVATISRAIKLDIAGFLEETGDLAGLPFKLHDFGFRGVSSVESAGIGGAAHLVNFMGTDTMQGIEFAYEYYGEPMAGFSIPAAEHSTITSWGREHEIDAFRNMIQQFGGHGGDGTGLYAVVSDSYDILAACRTSWGGELLEEVRAAPNMLVVRPDSGVPNKVVLDVIETLDEGFGHTVNDKGYKILDGVRVIQGDGVNPTEIRRILRAMQDRGWSADNIAFGMGGALLQGCNRDTQQFAFKASSISGTFGTRDVYKDPVTDHGKVSKRGRLRLVDLPGEGLTTVKQGEGMDFNDLLKTRYRNGKSHNRTTFAEVRERADAG